MTTTDYTTLPACQGDSEEYTNCYWDATTQGNGQGTSYYDIDGTVTYIEPALIDEAPPVTSCDEGFILAEDFSCVPTSFYEEPVAEAPVKAEVPIEGPTDTVYIPETGEIVDEATNEVLETIETVPVGDSADQTTELALTGPEDLSPLTVILGAGALLIGLAIRKLGARRA